MSVPKEDIEFEKIVNLLKDAEDDGTFFNSLYNLYFFIGITRGVEGIRNGRGIPLEDFRKEREALHESYRRRFGWKMSWWYVVL